MTGENISGGRRLFTNFKSSQSAVLGTRYNGAVERIDERLARGNTNRKLLARPRGERAVLDAPRPVVVRNAVHRLRWKIRPSGTRPTRRPTRENQPREAQIAFHEVNSQAN